MIESVPIVVFSVRAWASAVKEATWGGVRAARVAAGGGEDAGAAAQAARTEAQPRSANHLPVIGRLSSEGSRKSHHTPLSPKVGSLTRIPSRHAESRFTSIFS